MCSDPSACFSEMGPEVQMCSASCSRSGRAILGPTYMLQTRLAYIWGQHIYMLQIRSAYIWGRHMLLACVNLSSSGDSTKWTDLPIHCRIWFKQQKTCVIFIDNHETPGWVNFGSIQRCYIFARIQVQPFIRVQRSVLQASLPVYQAKQILPHSPCDTSKTQISLDSERSFFK